MFADAIETAGMEIEEWLPTQALPRELDAHDAVITLGGAMHPDQEREHPWLAAEKELLGRALRRGVPLLGVCLGAQLLAEVAGGAVRRAPAPEIGWYEVRTTGAAAADELLGPLAPAFQALEWHSYEFSLPPGAAALAHSERCLQAFRAAPRAWGIQFHAEVAAMDLEHWIDDYRSDPDAVSSGLDPDALRARSGPAIAAWNELGRELCARFLAAAGT